LQKVLAAAGVASRRAAEELIAAGRVSVDGEVVRVQGRRVDPARVRIEVDGERVNVARNFVIIAVNKPAGVITTAKDPHGRPTVLDLVRAPGRVYPVGRLDADTTGLLLLTNRGDLAHRLTHPRYQVPRVYLAAVRGIPDARALNRLRRGVHLEDGVARPSGVRLMRAGQRRAHLEITMTEGRKREVRRMLEAIGHPVLDLVRTAYGPIRLGRLRAGEWRVLPSREVGQLLEQVGL
jgi:23S rRNA pseudouridine2605 synthase